MKGKPRCFMSTVLKGMAMLVLLHIYLSGIILYNDTGKSIRNQSGFSPFQEKPLRAYVIEGVGYFLESYADFLLLQDKMEMTELHSCDFNELLLLLNNAISKMLHANEVYFQLKKKADVTSYNPVIINELLKFDYDAFSELERLNQAVFKKLEAFPSKDKIREMYGQSFLHTQGILCSANLIKEKMEEGAFPEISNLYALNETYVQSYFLGNMLPRYFKKSSKNELVG